MKKSTYNELWDNGIKCMAERMVRENAGRMTFDEQSKDVIFEEYCKLRDYTKLSYMRDPKGLLDRHKVCTCMILAICKMKPLQYSEGSYRNEDGYIMKNISNENLAITVGLSLLANFINSASEEKCEWLKGGFVFPKTERDSTYEQLLCLMLNYDVKDNHYSILAVSNILFLIEEYTKLSFQKKHENID